MRRYFFAALLLGVLAIVGACGSTSVPSGPSSVPSASVPQGPVMAPAPSGVSPEVWQVAFWSDRRLRRPRAVHIVLGEGIDGEAENVFRQIVPMVSGFIEGKTPMDLTADPSGLGNFTVVLNPSLSLDGQPLDGALTYQNLVDSSPGEVSGGRIEFSSVQAMHNKFLVMHEVFRTLGITGSSPVAGIMAKFPWPQLRPTDEEQRMILGRYNYPLLAMYSPGP